MGLLSGSGWPPPTKKQNKGEKTEAETVGIETVAENPNKSKEKKAQPEEMDVREAVSEFKVTVIEYRIQTGRELSEGEQRKLATEILLKHVQKHVSETRLESGLVSRSYEKGVKLWEKMPKLVQFMLSQSLTSAVSLYTGAYGLGITSKVDLGWRLATRVGINTVLKGVLEGVAEEVVNPDPKPTFIQRVGNVFQQMKKSSTTKALPFDRNSISATFKDRKPGETHVNTHTETPVFNNGEDTTINNSSLEQNLNMSTNENNTGIPKPGRSISVTGDLTLNETLESSTANIEQAKEEKRKMLKEILTFKNALLLGSLGPVFYLSGTVVGFTALGGMAVKEVYSYIIKQKTKLEEKKIKSEDLTKKISLTPMLNTEKIEIELDPKTLIKEFKALVPEVEKIAKNLRALKNYKEGGDILISLFSDLGTETAYYKQDITIDPQSEVFRHAPKAIKRFAKVGGIIEKAKNKTKEEKAKEIKNAPKEKLNELKIERVREMDDIDYEIFKVKQELKELRPKDKTEKNESALDRELDNIDAIKESIDKDPSMSKDQVKVLKERIKSLKNIMEARYILEDNAEKSSNETIYAINLNPENEERIQMLEAGKTVLEEIKQEIKSELNEIKNARNTLARLHMTPSEVITFDQKQTKIKELKDSEKLVYVKNIESCLQDIEKVYEELTHATQETSESLNQKRIGLEKELAHLLDRFNKTQDERYQLEGKTREQVAAAAKYKSLKKKRMELLLKKERADRNTAQTEEKPVDDMQAKINPDIQSSDEAEEPLKKAA